MSSFSLFRSADAFHTADDLSKEGHYDAICAFLCIAHALPLVACKSERIMKSIFFYHHWGLGFAFSFHAMCPLDGWNDNVIQPARDAVLNYCKVHAQMFPPTVLALKPIQPNSVFILCSSSMQNHLTSKNTCVSIIYPNFYTFFLCIPSVLFIGGRSYYTSSKFTSSSALNPPRSLQ